MLIRFSPPSEFQPINRAASAAPYRFAAGPSFKRGKFSQALIDVGASVYGLLFVVLFLGAVCAGGFFLLREFL